jgi:hypothetical protein
MQCCHEKVQISDDTRLTPDKLLSPVPFVGGVGIDGHEEATPVLHQVFGDERTQPLEETQARGKGWPWTT